MTPKEKAEELVGQFWESAVSDCDHRWGRAKLCALIAVDEMINQYAPIPVSHFVTSYKSADDFNENFLNIERQIKDFTAYRILYLQQVKNEIELL